jgi:hypothetical protein
VVSSTGIPSQPLQIPLNTESSSAYGMLWLGFQVVESGRSLLSMARDDQFIHALTTSLVYPYYILLGGYARHAYEELHDALHAPNNGHACMHA